MQEIEIIGLVAGALVALGFVPQVTRVWRLRSAKEISLPFNVLFLTGGTIWLIYGIVAGSTSVIVWNAINIVLLSFLLAAKLKYGMKNGKSH
jgi:MtN3 and saliva related transmembrane protein